MSTPPTTVIWTGLPVLLDVADGVTPITSVGGSGTATVGSPTPEGAVTYNPSNAVTKASQNGGWTPFPFQIEELPDSPELERAEQATSVKRYRMPYQTGVSIISFLGRGSLLQDNEGNTLRVLSTSLKREKPNACVLTITSESTSFDTPPDEFSVEPIELGVDIVKYPRYFYALLPQPTDSAAVQQVKQAIVRAIQTYRDSPFFPPNSGQILNGLLLANQFSGQVHDNILSMITTGNVVVTIPNINFVTVDGTGAEVKPTADSSYAVQQFDAIVYPPKASSTDSPIVNPVNIRVSLDALTSSNPSAQLALCAAQEIISKIWRQEDTPYQVAFQVTWSSYYFIKPQYNPGGYLEDPITDTGVLNPGLPIYFYSPDFTEGTTIFDDIAQANPQCYSSDGTTSGVKAISWLRKADVVDYQRTWFKVTRTWIGAPQAHWDSNLYNQGSRPGTGEYAGAYPFGYNVLNLPS